MSQNLKRWHQIVENRDWNDLLNILADDVEFHSPFVWTPKHGKMITAFILKNVTEILEDFQYKREWIDNHNIALEFSARLITLKIKGIDLIRFNDRDKIEHFEVMLRPANALMLVGDLMTKRIEKTGIRPK